MRYEARCNRGEGLVRQFRLGVGACAFALSAVLVAQAAYGRAVPSVRVSARDPLVVVGAGFAPEKQLRLTVTGGSAVSRTVRSAAGGTFIAQFPTIRPSRCAALSVVVRSSGTVVARGFSKPAPECAERADG